MNKKQNSEQQHLINHATNTLNRYPSKNKILTLNQIGQSTTIRQSNNQKQNQKEIIKPVKEFQQNSPIKVYQDLQNNKENKVYGGRVFFRDINNINSLFNNVLTMISSNDLNLKQKKQKDLNKITLTIKELVRQNIKIKEEIDLKYKKYCDLEQLSAYLKCSLTQLTQSGQLEQFIHQYIQKEQYLRLLEQQCLLIQKENKNKKTRSFSEKQIKQKQKKCKLLKKEIEKQKRKCQRLQNQQKHLLKNVYKTQKQVTKYERLSSALKMQINQIQSENEYQKNKNRVKSAVKVGIKQKQNVPLNLKSQSQLKCFQRQRIERVKSNGRLSNMLKK